jgi:uncharacterized protein
LTSLDLLRGVAILGILVMNVYAFAMPLAAYTNPFRMGGDDPLNLGIWILSHVVFDQKFMSIFAMLFGAGIVLMMERTERRGVDFGPFYFRRQFWLLVIGLLHLVFIWLGDILSYYAIVSFVVYFARRLPVRLLVTIACVMLPVPLLISYAYSFHFETLLAEVPALEASLAAGEALSPDAAARYEEWQNTRPLLMPSADDLDEEIRAHTGGYAEAVHYRIEHSLPMLLTAVPFFIVWRVGGLMLLGMALMRTGLLSANRPDADYRRVILAGYGIGLPLTAASAWLLFATGFDPVINLRYGSVLNYVGSILVAFGHIGVVMLVAKHGIARSVTARLEAVGRMALTNYLVQSLVMTSLFYGYALGLYGSLERSVQMLLVIAVLLLQIVVSPWWLKRFRFGPVEWLWRSLCYGRVQRMRASATAGYASGE